LCKAHENMQGSSGEILESALDAVPPHLFAGRYQLLPKRVKGSQGLVQFAQADDAFFAIKCGPSLYYACAMLPAYAFAARDLRSHRYPVVPSRRSMGRPLCMPL
jgi:hypothetical protein